ncbi:MAG: cell division FtsA domain-containing protein, partial [Bacilli bacterium]|nr:cell division FtsA domain-containing protein [Bacilli bacterium]
MEVVNNSGEKISINQFEISQIVEARLREIIKSVKNEINNLTNREISYIIVTGGITNLMGFPYIIDEEFNCEKIITNITTLGVRSNIYSASIGFIKYFDYKMKFRNIDYSMFNEEDRNELTAKKKKVSGKENLITKFSTYLKN